MKHFTQEQVWYDPTNKAPWVKFRDSGVWGVGGGEGLSFIRTK